MRLEGVKLRFLVDFESAMAAKIQNVGCSESPTNSGQNFLNHVAMHIGQSEVATGITEG